MGIVYDSAVDSDVFTSTALFDDDMALIVKATNSRIGPQDLTGEHLKLVAFPAHYALRKMIHSGGLNPIIAAEAETIDVILQLVASGVGDAILPCRLPKKMLDDHGLKKLPISSPLLRRKVVLISRADKSTATAIKSVLEVAHKVARKLPDESVE